MMPWAMQLTLTGLALVCWVSAWYAGAIGYYATNLRTLITAPFRDTSPESGDIWKNKHKEVNVVNVDEGQVGYWAFDGSNIEYTLLKRSAWDSMVTRERLRLTHREGRS